MSIEERYQRDININRVKKDIAPYFANEKDRFSSALILAVQNDEDMEFEPLDQIGNIRSLPGLYKSSAGNMGFLTLSGGEVFIPLDGQHRAKALKFAISGTDDSNVPLPGVKANSRLASEDISVILFRFDAEKARRIFNKVNKYAKATQKGQNVITDDDDQVAIVTRRLANDDEGVIRARLVRHQSNTLNVKAPEFTTLATFYDANKEIIRTRFAALSKPERATPEQAECFFDELRSVWKLLLGDIEHFAEAIQDPSEDGDARRMAIRAESLLGKPIGQLVLVKAFLLLFDRCDRVQESELCQRLNAIDWRIENSMWQNVLVTPDHKMLSGPKPAKYATLFVAHLGGARLLEEERVDLVEAIAGDQPYELPMPIV